MGMNVLSLFDGMSCGRIALERVGIKVDNYFASEIDKYAIQVSKHNYPDIIHLGNVEEWEKWDLPKIDLIIGGSPCQGFSFAGKGLNFEDPRSKLFFKFVDIVNHYKPKYFMLENVKMKKESENVITEMIGVEPIEINSALVSAQNRIRKYWTNIPNVKQPEDKNIKLSDILIPEDRECRVGAAIRGRYGLDGKIFQQLEIRKDEKSNTLTTVQKDNVISYIKTDKKLKVKKFQNKASCLTGGANSGGNHSDMDILVIWPNVIRRYSTLECERLQTVPEGYTSCVSNSQRYKMLGNGWTVDVIAHILINMEV